MAWELSESDQLILVCGRYEGVDERIRFEQIDMEVSIGDYILSNGELGGLIVLDTVSRLIPGVLGGEGSNKEDSFEDGLLEYPHYTRPRVFRGRNVPEVLLSGDHEEIRLWRRRESLKRTLKRRPELLEKASLSQEDRMILLELKEEDNV
jgi:tRNA (guanine37-N1)-methyltransferase